MNYHPLYDHIVEQLLDADMREFLPERDSRRQAFQVYLDQDDERQTDVIEMPEEGLA
jgi:hypothetical protein